MRSDAALNERLGEWLTMVQRGHVIDDYRSFLGLMEDKAHHTIYAGALDMAVGPRWYSLCEMACNTVKSDIEGEVLHAVPYGGVSEAERSVLRAGEDPRRIVDAIQVAAAEFVNMTAWHQALP